MTAKYNMLTQQLRASAVLNQEILSLYESLPREQFVPAAYQPVAYADLQIPLPFGQRMMTPVEEGLLLQSLHLTGHETVLEIGTGTGFLTTLLSHLCRKVISVDIQPSFIETASANISQFARENVQLIHGNAYNGWSELAPYDCIVFTGAMPEFNELLREQLVPNGRLFCLIGSSPVLRAMLYTLSSARTTWQQQFIYNTSLPALTPICAPHSFVF